MSLLWTRHGRCCDQGGGRCRVFVVVMRGDIVKVCNGHDFDFDAFILITIAVMAIIMIMVVVLVMVMITVKVIVEFGCCCYYDHLTIILRDRTEY